MMIFLIGVLGLALGSFVNALVWRIYMRTEFTEGKQKSESKKQGVNSSQLSIWKGRSMCPSCKQELAARDLVPIFSWLLLRGKCRYCNKPISYRYPLVELLTTTLFVLTYVFWPYQLTNLVEYSLLFTFYFLLVPGVALLVYDLKWMILPNKLVYSFNVLCFIFLLTLGLVSKDFSILLEGVIGATAFSGFFYVLYQISGGKWIGGGDVRLAVGLGLVLGWQKSILALTVAAYLGTGVILVLVLLKKYRKKMKLPFGPFLLAAMYATFLWGQAAIDWYLRLSGL